MILQVPHLVRTVRVVLAPELHLHPDVPVAVGDVEDEVVPLAPDVFPLQPPLLVNPTMMIPAQHSGTQEWRSDRWQRASRRSTQQWSTHRSNAGKSIAAQVSVDLQPLSLSQRSILKRYFWGKQKEL